MMILEHLEKYKDLEKMPYIRQEAMGSPPDLITTPLEKHKFTLNYQPKIGRWD